MTITGQPQATSWRGRSGPPPVRAQPMSYLFGITDEPSRRSRHPHPRSRRAPRPKDARARAPAWRRPPVSALTGIPVRADVAMTGEITLRGEVTAIGGLKEKLLAALRGGIRTVLIPERTSGSAEIPANVNKGLEIVPVRWIDRARDRTRRYPAPVADALPTAPAAAERLQRKARAQGRPGRAPAKPENLPEIDSRGEKRRKLSCVS